MQIDQLTQFLDDPPQAHRWLRSLGVENVERGHANLVAMAERREAQTQKARDYRAGGFAFTVVSFEGVEIYLGEGRKGAVATDPDIHTKDFVTVVVRRGLLEIRVNDKVFDVAPGEAVSFDCVFPHQYVAQEDTEMVIVLHPRR